MDWLGAFLCLVVVGFTVDSIFEKYFNHRMAIRRMELDKTFEPGGEDDDPQG